MAPPRLLLMGWFWDSTIPFLDSPSLAVATVLCRAVHDLASHAMAHDGAVRILVDRSWRCRIVGLALDHLTATISQWHGRRQAIVRYHMASGLRLALIDRVVFAPLGLDQAADVAERLAFLRLLHDHGASWTTVIGVLLRATGGVSDGEAAGLLLAQLVAISPPAGEHVAAVARHHQAVGSPVATAVHGDGLGTAVRQHRDQVAGLVRRDWAPWLAAAGGIAASHTRLVMLLLRLGCDADEFVTWACLLPDPVPTIRHLLRHEADPLAIMVICAADGFTGTFGAVARAVVGMHGPGLIPAVVAHGDMAIMSHLLSVCTRCCSAVGLRLAVRCGHIEFIEAVRKAAGLDLGHINLTDLKDSGMDMSLAYGQAVTDYNTTKKRPRS